MNRNLRIAYFLSFVNELYLPLAIWLLFFLKYLDFTQVAVIGALGTVSSNLFEIPTGAISDLIGRKWTLFLSFAVSAIGLLVIALGNTFTVFALGRIINGLGSSLFSGTHESLMYDTLKTSGKESTYDHAIAKAESVAWIGLFLAAIFGGFIYDFWPTGPFYITAIIYSLTALLCLFLKEPRVDSEKFSFSNYLAQNTKGFTELFKDLKTTQISLIMITVASGYFIAAKILGISQAEEYGLDGKGVGLLFGTGYIISAVFSYYYPKIRNRVGNIKLLIISVGVLLSSFIFAPFAGIVGGGILIIMRISSSTIFGNAKSVIMNRFIDSKNRATALSTLTLLSQIPFTLSFYFIGKYIDHNSPNSFALLLGVILIIFLFPQIFFFRNILLRLTLKNN